MFGKELVNNGMERMLRLEPFLAQTSKLVGGWLEYRGMNQVIVSLEDQSGSVSTEIVMNRRADNQWRHGSSSP
jgi:hypothetical protein